MAGGCAHRLIPALLLAGLLVASHDVQAMTLDRIAATQTVRIGFIADQPPFSSADGGGAPQGYAIDLCGRIVEAIREMIPGAQPAYVETTIGDAFDAVANGEIDLLCGAVTATLTRRELVDFSQPTFLTGMSALVRLDSPPGLREMAAGEREISPPRSLALRPFATSNLGVRGDTTTEIVLRKLMDSEGYGAAIVPFRTHQAGLEALEARRIDAYFADRELLTTLMASARHPINLELGDRLFTHEAYAIALTRGDADFRLLVDRTLSRFYRTTEFTDLLRRFFGRDAVDIRATVVAQSLPE